MYATIYNHSRDRSGFFATKNTDESLTQQSDAKDCDINIIMKRYGVTGQLPQVTVQPMYGDFTDVTDYREAVERIKAADTLFAQIPAKVRKEFDNNPAKFFAFANDPKNADELLKMGLAIKRQTDTITPTPVITPTPEPAPKPDEGKK